MAEVSSIEQSVHYYLTDLRLKPHETRAIDMRELRDAQKPDFRGNKIPASATDGGILWSRAKKVAVIGRTVMIGRRQGMASTYNCTMCQLCPNPSFTKVKTTPPSVICIGERPH